MHRPDRGPAGLPPRPGRVAAARLAGGARASPTTSTPRTSSHDGTLDLDAYRVLVLSVHPEYWSAEAYRASSDWVFERGGRLMYLGGNGLNCEVEFLDGGTAMLLNEQDDESAPRHRRAVDNYLTLASNYGDMIGVLAGPGIERERQDEQRPHGAGRLHRGGRRSRSLRRRGRCPSCTRPSACS